METDLNVQMSQFQEIEIKIANTKLKYSSVDQIFKTILLVFEPFQPFQSFAFIVTSLESRLAKKLDLAPFLHLSQSATMLIKPLTFSQSFDALFISQKNH